MNDIILMPHEILARARESAGIDVACVAAELNLTNHVVRTFESGRYEALYGDAFVCGLIRSYSGMLEVDAAPLIRVYRESMRPQSETGESQPVRQELHLFDQHKQYRTGYGIAAALVLAIVVGMFVQRDKTAGDTMPTDDAIAIDTVVGTTVVNSMADMPVENPTQDILPELMQPVSSASAAGVSAEQQMQDDLSSLNFTFSADCWVEVFDGDNRKIFSSLQRAQQRLELSGKPPFRITLGYAPGVALTYNSEPVPIAADDDNMAKLILGNS